MINKYKLIKSIKELKELSSGDEPLECFITLAGGLVKSSKSILYHNKKFSVVNEIDGTEQSLTEKQLKDPTYTNIYTAIKNKALFAYPR